MAGAASGEHHEEAGDGQDDHYRGAHLPIVGVSVVGDRIETVTPAELLAFEAANPHHTPTRAERIRRELGITPIRYFVLLRHAAESAEGIAAHPVTARQVRERAERRATTRERRAA